MLGCLRSHRHLLVCQLDCFQLLPPRFLDRCPSYSTLQAYNCLQVLFDFCHCLILRCASARHTPAPRGTPRKQLVLCSLCVLDVAHLELGRQGNLQDRSHVRVLIMVRDLLPLHGSIDGQSARWPLDHQACHVNLAYTPALARYQPAHWTPSSGDVSTFPCVGMRDQLVVHAKAGRSDLLIMLEQALERRLVSSNAASCG